MTASFSRCVIDWPLEGRPALHAVEFGSPLDCPGLGGHHRAISARRYCTPQTNTIAISTTKASGGTQRSTAIEPAGSCRHASRRPDSMKTSTRMAAITAKRRKRRAQRHSATPTRDEAHDESIPRSPCRANTERGRGEPPCPHMCVLPRNNRSLARGDNSSANVRPFVRSRSTYPHGQHHSGREPRTGRHRHRRLRGRRARRRSLHAGPRHHARRKHQAGAWAAGDRAAAGIACRRRAAPSGSASRACPASANRRPSISLASTSSRPGTRSPCWRSIRRRSAPAARSSATRRA